MVLSAEALAKAGFLIFFLGAPATTCSPQTLPHQAGGPGYPLHGGPRRAVSFIRLLQC